MGLMALGPAGSLAFALLVAVSAVASASLNERCLIDLAPRASFGILAGSTSPHGLQVLDLLNKEVPGALPLANPVLTPELLDGVAAITNPTLIPHPQNANEAYMLFAARACGANGRWGIAAAGSLDGGLTWRPLGWALREEDADLLGAAAFEHHGTWYLLPEVKGSGEVRLYRAAAFPNSWQPGRVLMHLEQPLRGASMARHDGRWWLVGSQHGAGLGGQDHVLAVFSAPALHGPWAPHGDGTFAVGAASTAGPLFVWQGAVHRVGRSCRAGECGPAELVQMSLTAASVEQTSQALDLGHQLWRQRSRWDAAGWSTVSMGRCADGAFLAVVEGRPLPHLAPTLPRQLATAVAVCRAAVLLCIVLLLLSGAARTPPLRRALARRAWGQAALAWMPGPAAPGMWPRRKGEAPHSERFWEVLPGAKGVSSRDSSQPTPDCEQGSCSDCSASPALRQPMLRSDSASSAHRRSTHSGGVGSVPSHGTSSSLGPGKPSLQGSGMPAQSRLARLHRSLPPRRVLLALCLLAVALCSLWAADAAARIAAPFAEPPAAVAVQGRHSRFTLMVMSYDRRLAELRWYVSHYSQCPSVGEILVVWNRGPPPNPATDLPSAVPVRVRVEALNSMNNRFRPDPELKFRAVLSLDDDIMMPCSTVEEAFAAWRAAPHRLLGFYPRLLLPERPGGPPVYQFEEFVFQQGGYNAILAGAAFMDAHALFPAYASPAAAPARALVDEVFNCDDLLLNFVAANQTRHAGPEARPPARLMRPRRRLDLSRLSGVGISHNPARFKAAADRCLAEFSALFGGSPLVVQDVPAGYGSPPNCHVGLGLDCMYLTDA